MAWEQSACITNCVLCHAYIQGHKMIDNSAILHSRWKRIWFQARSETTVQSCTHSGAVHIVHTHPTDTHWSKLKNWKNSKKKSGKPMMWSVHVLSTPRNCPPLIHSFHPRSPRRTVGKCWHRWHAIECGARGARREFKILNEKRSRVMKAKFFKNAADLGTTQEETHRQKKWQSCKIIYFALFIGC